MTRIVWYPRLMMSLEGIEGVIFTSMNGVRAFSRVAKRRDLTVYAVGDQTAAVAREKGFSEVVSADGGIRELSVLLRRSRISGRVAHIGSEDSRFIDAGVVEVERVRQYRAEAILRLPCKVKQAWRRGRIESVLAFSARSARFLVQTLEKEGYAPEGRVRALCISPRVAQALAMENPEFRWREILTSPRPRQESMLQTLKEASGVVP